MRATVLLCLAITTPRPSHGLSASVPRILFEDAHIALMYKPAGVGVFLEESSIRPNNRNGPPLLSWANSGHMNTSTEHDAIEFTPVTRLRRPIPGIVPIAKTVRALNAIQQEQHLACKYLAVVEGIPKDGSLLKVGSLSSTISCLSSSQATSISAGRLSLASILADARVDSSDLCNALARDGNPIVGSQERHKNSFGGVHLAMVSLCLPSSFEKDCPASASSSQCFEIEPPKKFQKTMKRERLHAERREAAKIPLTDSTATFMGLNLQIGAHELKPRQSSACVVQAAVAYISHSMPAKPNPLRILDLGCGCGALLLGAMHLLKSRSTVMGVGLDIAPSALLWAQQNAAAIFGPSSETLGWKFLQASFSELEHAHVRDQLGIEPYDVILCNPPYLREQESERITAEADRALFAGLDGLGAYAAIAHSLSRCQPPLLAPGKGVLALQIPGASGSSQQKAIKSLFTTRGFKVRDSDPDERGILRCLLVSRPAEGND